MKFRLPAALAVIAALLLSLIWSAVPASAHTKNLDQSCESLTVELINYKTQPKDDTPNHVQVWINGNKVSEERFGAQYVKAFQFEDKSKVNTWRVKVHAWDDQTYSFDESGESAPCGPALVPNNPQVSVVERCGFLGLTFTNNVSLGAYQIANNAIWTLDGQTITVAPNAAPVVKTFEVAEDAADRTVTLDNRTYTLDSDCQPNVVENNPHIDVVERCGSLQFTFTNNVTLGAYQIANNATWTLDGQTITVAPNAAPVVKTFEVAEDAADRTVTLDNRTYTLDSDCQPNVVENNPSYIFGSDCGIATLTLNNDVATGEHEVVGDAPAVFEIYVDSKLVETIEVMPNDEPVVREYTFDEDSGTHTIQVNDGDVHEVDSDCEVEPTPENPKPTPTPTEVGVLHQSAPAASAAPAPATDGALASTGSSLTGYATAAAAALLAGTVLMMASRRRRETAPVAVEAKTD